MKARWLQIASNLSDPSADPKRTYPTSSKAPKDWDKIEGDAKEEEKNGNLDGDAALQRLFKQIYSNADEDTRRAMNKSFQVRQPFFLYVVMKQQQTTRGNGEARQQMEKQGISAHFSGLAH